MNVVRLSAMLVVASTLPALGQIHYTPSVQHYRLHSTVQRSQEQNGQKTDGVITNEQQVTVTIQAPGSKGTLTDKDTLQFAVTLDSVNMSSNLAVQLPNVQVMQGTKVSGVMLPSGKVLRFGSDTKATDGVDRESIVASMAHFLLTLPATAGAGATWSDTATTNFSKDGSTLKHANHHDLEGDRRYDGRWTGRVAGAQNVDARQFPEFRRRRTRKSRWMAPAPARRCTISAPTASTSAPRRRSR